VEGAATTGDQSGIRLAPETVVGGRYEIAAHIGQGGVGVVYRARDRVENIDVALKVLKTSSRDAGLRLHLRHEFRAMTRLRHPRMVEVYDYGTLASGAPFFTMELLEGADLAGMVQLPMPDVYRIVLSVADVLAFMHTRGFVHRDIKPANVRVLPRKRGEPISVKLMDFGTAEIQGGGHGALAGTMRYLAPEAHYGAAADPRRDLYALGVLAYEITAGRAPFEAATAQALFEAKLAPMPRFEDRRTDVPLPFARLVEDLLAPEPNARPRSAGEVIARLEEFGDADVRADPAVYLRTPALVGRDRDLATFRGLLGKARAGVRTAIFLCAPAGAGKTRMCEEALLEARLTGVHLAATRARRFGGAPYEALRQLLRVLTHLPGGAEALAAAGGQAALGPANPAYTGSAGATADPTAERGALHRTVGALLAQLTRHGPLVLSIDDIHLADSASLECLAAIMAEPEPAPIALVGTIREGEPLPGALKRMRATGHELSLSPLDGARVRELIVSTLGKVTPTETLASDLAELSGGNVYFILEILRTLVAHGAIRRSHTGIHLPDALSADDAPRSLTDALTARTDALESAPRELALIIATFERDVELILLPRLFSGDDDAFFDALDVLRRQELVDIEGATVKLHHPRVREVLQASSPAETQRALHVRAAEILEERYAREAERHAAEIGFHFAAGGDRVRGLRYLVMAGDLRYDAFAYYDAGDAYRRAIALLDAAPRRQRKELERKLCDRLGRIDFLYDHHSAIGHFQRASELHLAHGLLWAIPALARVFGRAAAAGIAVGLSALGNLLRLRRQPLRQVMAHYIDAFAARTYVAVCHTLTGRLRTSLEVSETLRPYVYSKKRLPRSGFLNARMSPLLFQSQFERARRAVEESLHVLETDHTTPLDPHDRVNAMGGVLATRYWVDLLRGYTASSVWLDRLLAHASKQPSATLDAWCMEIQVTRGHLRGDLGGTLRTWAAFCEKGHSADIMFGFEKSRVYVGRTLAMAGRIGEAADIADHVIAVAKDCDHPILGSLAMHLKGLTFQLWGSYDEAERCFADAQATVERPEVGADEIRTFMILAHAELALDRGNERRAEDLARFVRDRAVADPIRHDLMWLRAQRLLGRAHDQRDELEEARQCIEASLEVSVVLANPLERALCEHYAAVIKRRLGEDTAAAGHANRAEDLLAELDNAFLLRRLGYRDTTSTQTPELRYGLSSSGLTSKDSSASLDDTLHPSDSQRVEAVPDAFAETIAPPASAAAGDSEPT
jgi:tetratricopeptide (TPR) repeat protein